MDTLGAMVDGQAPLLAVVVPLIQVAVIGGRHGVRRPGPAALVAGVVLAAVRPEGSSGGARRCCWSCGLVTLPATPVPSRLARPGEEQFHGGGE